MFGVPNLRCEMKSAALPLLSLICCVFIPTSLSTAVFTENGKDPCTIAGPLHSMWKRQISVPAESLCDIRITPGWYKVGTGNGSDLVTTCPGLFECGTNFPVWLNGTIPEVSEGIVDRTACQTSLFVCCDEQINVRAKNCGDFRVWYLEPTTGCPLSYCFEDSDETTTTTTTTTSTTSTTTTTILPAITKIPISGGDHSSIRVTYGPVERSTLPHGHSERDDSVEGQRKEKPHVKDDFGPRGTEIALGILLSISFGVNVLLLLKLCCNKINREKYKESTTFSSTTKLRPEKMSDHADGLPTVYAPEKCDAFNVFVTADKPVHVAKNAWPPKSHIRPN